MSLLLPPTSRLSSIRDIPSRSPEDLLDALHYLRLVYTPEVRGSRLSLIPIGPPPEPGSQESSADFYTEDDLDSLRSDDFELSYAIKWLTALVSQAESWELRNDTTVDPGRAGTYPSSKKREIVIQEAASLLAVCAGAASAGILTRIFTFASRQVRDVIKVQLRDVPLENHEYASVGAQTWGSACVLAERIVERPNEFGLLLQDADSTIEVLDPCPSKRHSLRVLELGAGTGLVSLALGKLLERDANWVANATTIIATDVYPSVLSNLRFNISSNLTSSDTSVSLASHLLDWSNLAKMTELSPPFDEPFDLIFGADIVYEAQHATWIKSCLQRLLRKPCSLNDTPLFHLIIPLRPTHACESSTIEETFLPSDVSIDGLHHEATEIGIISRERIIRDTHRTGHGRGREPNEVEYAYYKIGWIGREKKIQRATG